MHVGVANYLELGIVRVKASPKPSTTCHQHFWKFNRLAVYGNLPNTLEPPLIALVVEGVPVHEGATVIQKFQNKAFPFLCGSNQSAECPETTCAAKQVLSKIRQPIRIQTALIKVVFDCFSLVFTMSQLIGLTGKLTAGP